MAILGSEPTDRDVARRALIVSTIALGVLAVGLVVGRYFQLFLLLFAGILVAVLLRAGRETLVRRTGMPPAAALLTELLLITGAIVGVGWMVGPSLAEQIADLRDRLPEALTELRAKVAQLPWGRRLLAQAPATVEKAVEAQGGVVQGATNLFSTVVGGLTGLFIVLFIGIFIAAEPRRYADVATRLAPPRQRSRIDEVLGDTEDALRHWLVARGIGMAFVGTAVFIGLLIIGQPLALVFGLLAGLFDFIPYFGPLIAAAPAVLLALVEGPTQALYVAAIYVGVQTVQNFLFEPLIERKTVRLLPAAVLAFQVILGSVGGILGAALASPLLAAITVIVKRLYIEDTLDEGSERSATSVGARSAATTRHPAATK